MASAPLESSSTSPRAVSPDATRPDCDPMEDISLESTRKRPRLDSGSGVCESLSSEKAETTVLRMSEEGEAAPAASAQEAGAPASNSPANRMAINMKPPSSAEMAPEPVDVSPNQAGVAPSAHSPPDVGANGSAAISLSSSPAQSPEIEVAEVEDMDQDPNASNWKPLEEAIRVRTSPEVVQLPDQLPLADTFPSVRGNPEPRENLEEIGAIIEKGAPLDVKLFLQVKNWLDSAVHNLDQITHDTIADDRDFWEEFSMIMESWLRRGSDFQPDEGQGPWICFEEFCLSYAQLALHLVQLDSLAMKQLVERSDIQSLDLLSKTYLPPLGWIIQISSIPFFRNMEKVYGQDVSNMIARVCDQVASSPFDVVQRLSEYTRCLLPLIARWPVLSQSLIQILSVAHQLVESGNERRKYRADDALVDTPAYMSTLKAVYGLLRDVDEKFQIHISKKSPWLTGDVAESILRTMSLTYHCICVHDPSFASQKVAKDLGIELPEIATPDDCASIILYGWRFGVLKKKVMDGRMELRVHGMETMQNDLVTVWRQHFPGNPPGVEHPVVRYLVSFLREHKIVDYVLGIDSHPQLICRSSNIVGFLIVTCMYTDLDTDTIWKTVVESQDPRTVTEVLWMFTRVFHMLQLPEMLYMCSKLLELRLDRFDARMIEFCEQLFHLVREKHAEQKRLDPLDNLHVDVIPVRLCVHLIRESSALKELSVEHKTHLQRFAGSQLSQFISAGLTEMDKMETYERCIQDIAEMNQYTMGSLQALQALLPSYNTQEIRKLATDFDLTRLVISETCYALDVNQTDFTDPFSRTSFLSRVQILARIIDQVPDTITADLADILWKKVFTSKELVNFTRRALWDMLCATAGRSTKPNQFIDHCIQACLPQLSPEDYSPELLSFVKQTIAYEVRFNLPQLASENEVISIPGMERVWNFILAAPPGSIETEATDFAIDVFLDHPLVDGSPRSAVEATHIALVDRCVEQLQSAAAKLKSVNNSTDNDKDESMTSEPSQDEIRAAELRFSRSLLFLRQLLHGLRTRPQYSPPQGSPPDLPGRQVKGELINIHYQAFHGGTQTQVHPLQIGDLSTASELVDRLGHLTGFSKFNTIYSGQKIDLRQKPDTSIRDLNIRSGLLLVLRDTDGGAGSMPGRRQSLTLVDSEVLKHFDHLYDLLFLEDHLAREIYDFLVVFPPQERVIQLVRSTDKTEKDIFPMEKPYSFLYSAHALSACLREEALEASPNEQFVLHSFHVLNAALTRPEMSESLENCRAKLLFANSLLECLLFALSVRPRLDGDLPALSNPGPLVQQLQYLMEVGRHLPAIQLPEAGIQKLICNSFSVLVEASVHDRGFWNAIKQHVQLDQLLASLLLDLSRQGVRKEVAERIVVACGPSHLLRSTAKLTDDDSQKPIAVSENPLQMDILTTIWDAFVQAMPRTADYPHQSQQFFEVAQMVFHSLATKSSHDLKFGEYLKQWGGIMLSHRTDEFVGREVVDHLTLGFSRLIRTCLDLAESHATPVDTFDLSAQLFDNYLFPDLSLPSLDPIDPQVPVMHNQTRQEMYNVLRILCRGNEDYIKMVESLEDIIPEDYAFPPTWCFDRSKMIRSPEGYAGLRNLSNTCYMNSLLTQLFMNIGFREFMLQIDVADPESSQRLLDETKKLFGNMQETWHKSVDSQGLVDTIRTYENEPIDVTIQMDVDEFYNLLFDRWEAQIVSQEAKKRFRSFYGGQLVQQIKSKECSHISERLEPFSAIQCDIKGKAGLEESLQAYVEGEVMQGDNKYSCTSCGRHVDAVKRACLKDVPDNLMFHLKRFDFDMVSMMRSKINDEFQFPEHIDMTPFTVQYLSDQNTAVEPDVFRLVGVLVHSGTAESGHYYSFIRERPTADTGGSWVEFNDSDVTRFDPSKIADQCFGGYNDTHPANGLGPVRLSKVWNAYMLFYQRVSNMESAKSVYNPERSPVPVHVPLPSLLGNHITMENELFIRTYCLLDPYHTLFVRYLLSRLHEVLATEGKENPKLVKSIIFSALDTLEQLVSRSKEPVGLDGIISELIRAISDIPKGAYRVLQWTEHRPAGIRNLILRSPHANVRDGSIRVIVAALAKLKELQGSKDLEDAEKEEWHVIYMNSFESVVAVLEGLWPSLQTLSRPWDDYFDFLLFLSAFGVYEVGVLLNYQFLVKCLEIIWLDGDDGKRLKRYYLPYLRLVERGRKFSHKKLMNLLAVLLRYIDFSAAPTHNDERQVLQNDKYCLTATESCLIWPFGRNGELTLLKKMLQQHSNPQACRDIFGLLLDEQPEVGVVEPICKTLEEGLRVAPAEICAPFLEATVVFCRRSSEEDRIFGLIDFVAKGIDSINNSGGAEHLAFFTNVLTLNNQRAGLDENWFISHVVDKIPDWAPPLLLYPEKTVRNMTVEVLRQILFSNEPLYTEVARELVQTCVDRLRRTYLAPGQNVEARSVEAINSVICRGLETYYEDNDEDREFVRYANEVHSAVEELTVDIPEELGSESDIPSPDEWEDNSMIPSDSDMGLAASP